MVTASPTNRPLVKPSQVKLSLDNAVCLIQGRRGEGKTTLAYNLAREYPRVLVYDSRWQFPLRPEDHWQIAYLPEELPALVRPAPEPFRVCYRSRFARFDFPYICKMLDADRFPEMSETLFVVDEILKVADRHDLPPWWDELVHFSRHGHIGLVITTQRPTDLHGDVQAEATDLIVFRQHHPRDIQRLYDVMGDAAHQVPTLPPFKALWWHKGDVHFPVDNTTLKVVP